MAKEIRLRCWAEVINARNASGKTVKAWCAEQGISTKTYYYRQKMLRQEACQELGGGLVPKGFAEVLISTAPTAAATPSPPGLTGRGEIRIEVAGIRISADSAYPAAKLAEFLRGFAPC